ncbi:Coordinator of PRMT5 and differentiation stimulator isoform X2 [Aix galericulata]|nr:Coordinator of PRMT5 and differentiation stimulator isoform X2 [Aix galericulata]
MAASLERTTFEEKRLPDDREAKNSEPRKVNPVILGQTKVGECLRKNIPHVLNSDSEESEFSDTSSYEDDVSRSPASYHYVQPDLEELDGEISNMLESVTSPEQQTASVYEVEDWDKELEESESNPYESPISAKAPVKSDTTPYPPHKKRHCEALSTTKELENYRTFLPVAYVKTSATARNN